MPDAASCIQAQTKPRQSVCASGLTSWGFVMKKQPAQNAPAVMYLRFYSFKFSSHRQQFAGQTLAIMGNLRGPSLFRDYVASI